MPLVAFDLEGPLTPFDAAFELFKLVPQGAAVYTIISRYDDLLALEEREGYEPGDTLSLVLPFILHYGIKEEQISRLGEEAPLTEGASELVSDLSSQGWDVFCISTAYEQFAHAIARRVGIMPARVASTRLPLAEYALRLNESDKKAVEEIEQLLSSYSEVDAQVKSVLDWIFWERFPQTGLGPMMREVTPVGGNRKVRRLEGFLGSGLQLKDAVVVGDSITDSNMLSAVNEAGGLAIAFNANAYALPKATMGLASTHLSDLLPVLKAWRKGGRGQVEGIVRRLEVEGSRGNRGHFHWLAGKDDLDTPLLVHRRLRALVREEAAALG